MAQADKSETAVGYVARLIDEGPWGGYQKAALVIAALAVILDGFDNQILSLAIPALIKDWGVTRDDFKWVLVVGFAGMAIGTALFGMVGDKIGRRPTLIGCVTLFAAVTLGIAFVDGIPPLYALRFLGGLGLGGAMPNATALLAEVAPSRRRAIGVTAGIVGIPVGGTIAGLVAAELLTAHGWRSLFLVGGIMPIVIAIIMALALPESPRFLARRPHRVGQLAKTLRRMGRDVDPADPVFQRVEVEQVQKVSLGTLFAHGYRRDTIGLWGAMFFTLTSVYGVVNWLPAVLGQAGYAPDMTSNGLTVFNLGGVVAALGGAFCFSWFGSRATLLVMAAVAAVSSVLLSMTPLDPTADPTRLLALLTIQGGALNGVQTTMYALGAFVYATDVRAAGVGWAVGIGRLGAIVSPLIGAALLKALGFSGFFQGIAATMALSFISIAIISRHVKKSV